MLVVLRHITHHIYDNIRKSINIKYGYETSDNSDILVNAIPIKFYGEHYILINYANIEISGLELNNKSYCIEYIVDEEINGEITINNVYCVHEIYSKIIPKEGDCYYDEHLNIMFIKFQDIRIEYIDINNSDLELYNINNNNINFIWLDNSLKKNIYSTKISEIFFENKFISLPKVPLILSNIQQNELNVELPMTGTKVVDDKNNFIGMVSYSNSKNIVIIPVVVLFRFFDYINYNPICVFNDDLILTKIVFGDEREHKYGLYYKSEKSKKNVGHYYEEKIILKIDYKTIDKKGMIVMDKYCVPSSTYMWLFSKRNKINVQGLYIKDKSTFRLQKNDNTYLLLFHDIDKVKYINYYIKLKSFHNNTLSSSKLNFVKYKKKYMLEVNEKIMQILKIIFNTTDDYDYFYDYIIKNKISKNKIIVIINDRLEIKIINKIKDKKVKDINTIVKHFQNKNLLSNFIDKY